MPWNSPPRRRNGNLGYAAAELDDGSAKAGKEGMVPLYLDTDGDTETLAGQGE